MGELTYRAAVNRALTEELARDPKVALLGEDIGSAGGVFKATDGLFARFGGDRVRDTPISEQAIVGAAIGAALAGMRPVAELMFADFAGVAFDQIANQMAKYRYMSGGQVTLPLTLRMAGGAGLGFGAQHSQVADSWFLGIPGLLIAMPSTATDLVGLLKTAIRSDDPVLVFEHKALYPVKEEVRAEEFLIPFGQASVVRQGTDLTLVTNQLARREAVAAAADLAARGVSVEIIDPRTLVPFDFDTVAASVRKTGRLLVVQEATFPGSWGATLAAWVASNLFGSLACGPSVLGAPEVPVPFAATLESAWLPSHDRITQRVLSLLSQPPPGDGIAPEPAASGREQQPA
jgi:acetoin:2,6-dichlorophenolindophenol oxidoreductase subunit beta